MAVMYAQHDASMPMVNSISVLEQLHIHQRPIKPPRNTALRVTDAQVAEACGEGRLAHRPPIGLALSPAE